jgi:hypothetical protein
MNTFQQRRGGVLMGLLITVAVLACVGIAVGVGIARHVLVNVNSTGTADGKDVAINVPGGSFTIRSHKNAGLDMVDIPRYPGARESKSGGGAEFNWTSDDGRDDKSFAVAGAEMITHDPADKVLDYYHERLPMWIVSRKRNGQISLEEPGAHDDSGRFIVIHEKFDGTHIGVASIGTPAAN